MEIKKDELIKEARYKFNKVNVYSSTEWMANSTKKYRSVFDTKETTYIYTELSFYNKLFDEQDWEAKINLKCFSLDGKNRKELCNIDSKKTISKEDNIVYIRDGWGTDTRGSYWKRGDYIWETYIENILVGSKKFYIENMGLVTLNENPYFDVNSLKFYIGGAEGIIKDRRVYLKKINRKTAQYLFAEFSFINKSENDWFCELFFNFYDDANQLKGQVSSIKYIEKNRKDEIITLEEGWGNSTPWTWIDDSYSVEIVFMDTLVAVASFEVGDEEENGEVEVFSSSDKCTILKTSSINIKEPESIDEVLKELNSLIGLEQIKKKINEHITYLNYIKLRKEKGFDDTEKISLHSVFTGNPGTGKTTVVRILGQLYKKMGLLSKGHVVEVDRADLVGEYIGQTAPKVKESISKARGGILFIDEAYSLARQNDDSKDFGKEVIEIILKEMSDGKGDIAIMCAGYPKEMGVFLESNPGLKSRFSYYFHFDDYLPEELFSIAIATANKKGMLISQPAHDIIKKAMVDAYRDRDKTFGNARFANAIINEAKINLGIRLMNLPNVNELSNDILSTIDVADVEKIFKSQNKKRLDLTVDNELLRSSLAELNNLIGIKNIKQDVDELIRLVQYYRETGKDILNKFSLHNVFVGNPGTGKTTVARIIGKIYKALGLLEKGHVVECERESLVAGYIGQTAIKTKEQIERAKGGVLFIDEAYALAGNSKDDFGKEAIEVILKNMEDMRGQFSVIVAGYPDNMNVFLESNPGLKSRFDRTFNFEDYSSEELFDIAKILYAAENLIPDAEATEHLTKYITAIYTNRDRYFGNARTIRKVVGESIKNQNLRMASVPASQRTKEMLNTLTLADVVEFVPEPNKTRVTIGFK